MNIYLLAGTNEENHSKNQTEQVIPFDRNRVILTPDGLRPHSTYINASFIEGYHNDESFIITQVVMRTMKEFIRIFLFYHDFCDNVRLNPPISNTTGSNDSHC